ncbi:MAG TPA: hypothetical protein VFV80_02080 [Geminicoccaceae bacterium]|nr:hypothetical protein [Geminicoccaceae bacterium]
MIVPVIANGNPRLLNPHGMTAAAEAVEGIDPLPTARRSGGRSLSRIELEPRASHDDHRWRPRRIG